MRVSVVIPVLNGEAFLAQAIRSALNQSLPPAEIIVADNGSKDASLQIASSFGPPVRVISVTKPGATAARAAGFAETTGEALMFLDADDLLAPDTLAHLVEALQGQEIAMTCCPWRRYEMVGECWRAAPASCAPRRPWHDDLAAWLTGWYHPPCSMLWSRAAYEKAGGWDPDTASNQDGDLVMRALIASIPLIRASGGLGYYRRLPEGQVSLSGKRSSPKGISARLRVLEKIEGQLREVSHLARYAAPLAEAYHTIATMCTDGVPEDLHARALDGVKRHGGFGFGRRARRRLGERVRTRLNFRVSHSSAPLTPAGDSTLHPTQEANPLVSVILPTYNRAATLDRAVQSVLSQSYQNLELLLVDDGSTDETAAYVATLQDERLQYLQQEQNQGVAAARNAGIAAAKGQLIAFLDSDDAWMPDKLSRQVAQMQRAPKRVGLLYTGLVVEHADGKIETWRPQKRGYVLGEMLQRNIVHYGTSSTMIRAEAAEVVGGFDTTWPANEDHDFWVRIARFYEFDFDPEPLAVYDLGGTNQEVEGKRSARFSRNMRARNTFVERHGFEASLLDAIYAYQMDSARRHLESDEGNVLAGRGLLLKAARAAPRQPLPYIWLTLSLLPRSLRARSVARLRRLRSKVPNGAARGDA